MENYLEAVNGFVIDDKKIVTYKWLSKKLKIHNTIAKKVLNVYIADSARKEKCLITYLLMGKVNDNLSVVIATESDVSVIKEQFDEIVTEHVYSIQESKPSIDLNTLYIADKINAINLQEDSVLRSIKYGNDNRIQNKDSLDKKMIASSEPVTKNKLKTDIFATTSTEQTVVSKQKINVQQSDKSGDKELNKSSNQENKKLNKKAGKLVKTTVASKGNIFLLWDKQNANGAKRSSTDRIEKPQTEKAIPTLSEDNSNSGDNSKVGNRSSVDDSKVESGSSGDNSKMESRSNGDNSKLECQSSDYNSTEMPNKKKSKNRKLNNATKEPIKKRKRIAVFSSSEDEADSDECDKNENYDEPEVATQFVPELELKPESGQPDKLDETCIVQNGIFTKKRKRKIIDETFIDDDGFMHTKKKIIYESCTEDDNDDDNGENNKNVNNGNICEEKKVKNCKDVNEGNIIIKEQVKQKSKQASIKNFFGKPKM